jgi:hypothetical protein
MNFVKAGRGYSWLEIGLYIRVDLRVEEQLRLRQPGELPMLVLGQRQILDVGGQFVSQHDIVGAECSRVYQAAAGRLVLGSLLSMRRAVIVHTMERL